MNSWMDYTNRALIALIIKQLILRDSGTDAMWSDIAEADVCVSSVTHPYSYCWVCKDGRCKSFVSLLTENNYDLGTI